MRTERKEADAGAACREALRRHLRLVAAERADICVDPAEGHRLEGAQPLNDKHLNRSIAT